MAVEMTIQEYVRERSEKDSFETTMFIYESALIQMASRIEVLNKELSHVYQYNPIEYVKTRLNRNWRFPAANGFLIYLLPLRLGNRFGRRSSLRHGRSAFRLSCLRHDRRSSRLSRPR